MKRRDISNMPANRVIIDFDLAWEYRNWFYRLMGKWALRKGAVRTFLRCIMLKETVRKCLDAMIHNRKETLSFFVIHKYSMVHEIRVLLVEEKYPVRIIVGYDSVRSAHRDIRKSPWLIETITEKETLLDWELHIHRPGAE